MESIESRLNFVTNINLAPSHAIEINADKEESYYQVELEKYCQDNSIDLSEDNCSAMIMSDYGAEEDTFFFWID